MSPRRPLGVRLLNRASRAARTLGVAPPLVPDALMRQAERATGLSDWSSDDRAIFEEGLAELCASIDAPPALNGLGRVALHLHLLRALSTRLMRIGAGPVRSGNALRSPVIVVVGLPRSGTTFLHRLLAAAPDARALKLWEVQHPVAPTRGPDRRRTRSLRSLATFSRLAPEVKNKHATDVDAPEECFFLLDDALVTPSFPLMFPVERYRQWRHQAPVEAAYRSYRSHLLRLARSTPSRRLVLKAPGHAEHLTAIADAVPEAIFVHTHRDPAVTVPSRASLVRSFHGQFTDHLDLHALGKACLDDALHLLRGSQAGRKVLPADRLIDVQYDDLIANPAAVVARIHSRVGLPLHSDYRRRLGNTPTAPAGPRHAYTAEEFGLSEASITAALADVMPPMETAPR